jgi:hypothetical protein
MTSATPLAPPASSALDPSHRILVAWIAVATLLALIGVTAVLAIGGAPDPPALRAAAPLLGEGWRFHTGDDPRWADAGFDDSGWETVDLSAPATSTDGDVGLPNFTKGWMARGHAGYEGYAWYRLAVPVPPGSRTWEIIGPTAVDHAYELYWNGARLGGSGRLGANPRVVGTRPMIFPLPAAAAGTTGVLAIRVFLQPGLGSSGESGGIRVAPTLAPRPESQALFRAQWWRTIAGYLVEVVEPLAMALLIGLALVVRRRSDRQAFIAFTCAALLVSALKRLDNAIVAWTDLMSLPTYLWLPRVLWTPLSLAGWALAWNRWRPPPSRAIDGAALALGAIAIACGAMELTQLTQFCRLGFLALFAAIAVRIAGAGPHRVLAGVTMALILAAQYPGELSAIGVPGIWFPFGIGVTLAQYAYAAGVPLLALLIVQTLVTKGTARASAV